MRWFLTTSFEFVEYPKWTFDEFDVALDTAKNRNPKAKVIGVNPTLRDTL